MQFQNLGTVLSAFKRKLLTTCHPWFGDGFVGLATPCLELAVNDNTLTASGKTSAGAAVIAEYTQSQPTSAIEIAITNIVTEAGAELLAEINKSTVSGFQVNYVKPDHFGHEALTISIASAQCASSHYLNPRPGAAAVEAAMIGYSGLFIKDAPGFSEFIWNYINGFNPLAGANDVPYMFEHGPALIGSSSLLLIDGRVEAIQDDVTDSFKTYDDAKDHIRAFTRTAITGSTFSSGGCKVKVENAILNLFRASAIFTAQVNESELPVDENTNLVDFTGATQNNFDVGTSAWGDFGTGTTSKAGQVVLSLLAFLFVPMPIMATIGAINTAQLVSDSGGVRYFRVWSAGFKTEGEGDAYCSTADLLGLGSSAGMSGKFRGSNHAKILNLSTYDDNTCLSAVEAAVGDPIESSLMRSLIVTLGNGFQRYLSPYRVTCFPAQTAKEGSTVSRPKLYSEDEFKTHLYPVNLDPLTIVGGQLEWSVS